MAKLLYQLEGVRGRNIAIYDKKCVISTKVTVGSIITGNMTDGEKTIFYSDVMGVQFKKSGNLIGYLQFETASVQMNNQNSNMFSENTFTFEHGKNGISNEQMEAIYHYVCDLIEAIKYGTAPAAAPAVPVAPAAPVMPAAPVAPAAQPLVCPKCGSPRDAANRFCMVCGERLG